MAKGYKVRNQFRYNNSKEAAGHPHYIFGETDEKYISLGLTTHPKKNMSVVKLKKSPNPYRSKKKKQYVQRKVFVIKKEEYGNKRLKGWAFHSEDFHIIRHLRKQYKKKGK